MTLYITNAANNAANLEKYCKPHGIDPDSIISIAVDSVLQNYTLEYTNKDGHYCTMLVWEKDK